MSNWLSPFLGGLLGTVAMTVFLLFPRWLKLGNVDVIRAVGALVTGKVENAWQAGAVIHAVSGLFFAYVYAAVIVLSKLPVIWWTFAILGLLHGVIVMLLVCIMVMEHHPIGRYHDRGPMTGFMQLLAHGIYGVVVGIVVQVMH